MSFLPCKFEEYISVETNRLVFLQKYLSDLGVKTTILQISDKKHLFVVFPESSYDERFPVKTVICHYDRVANSPGANDNSFANLVIADFAAKINEMALEGRICNIRICFTDGEELGDEGVFCQGAYGLANYFKKANIKSDEFFVFDACGRGDVPILAKTGIEVVKKSDTLFKRKFLYLYEKTKTILETVSPRNWMTLPVPYSDNAGFLACGIPCVVITFLPKEEANSYLRHLNNDNNLEKEVMNCKLSDDADFEFKYREKMPMTWRLFHTEFDNTLSLTPNSYNLLNKILFQLL
ncbi:MAG: M28 family peptidase [Treponema sp.]|nr:M28 family peptidase [Treponema sp.]